MRPTHSKFLALGATASAVGVGAPSRSRRPRHRGGGCDRHAGVGSAAGLRLREGEGSDARRGVLMGRGKPDPAGGGAAAVRRAWGFLPRRR